MVKKEAFIKIKIPHLHLETGLIKTFSLKSINKRKKKEDTNLQNNISFK